MIETLNKIAYKSDEIISSVPMPLYFAIICIGVLAVGQSTYDYVNQEPLNNLTINLDFLYDSNYIHVGGIMEQIEIPVYQGPVRPSDDEDYFRLTGITKYKEKQ